MKNTVAALLIALLGLSVAQAQDASSYTKSERVVNNTDKAGQFGLGLEVGSLSGLNLEYWTASDRAINGTIAAENNNFAVNGAHLWIFRNAFASASRPKELSYFAPYIGAGALAIFGTNSDYFNRTANTSVSFALAAQIPLGIEFLPTQQRFSIFGEIAPSLEIAPVASGFVTADIGAKFYF